MSTRLTRVAAVLFAAAAVGRAQDSAPAAGAAQALRPAMLRLQEGRWDTDSAVAVVKALAQGGHAIAARWWLDSADAAREQSKLPPASKATLFALRREVESKASTPEQLKLARTLVRHAESAATSKNHEEAERLARLVAVYLEVVPEPQAAKTLAALQKALQGQPRNDFDQQNLLRQRRESMPNEAAAQTVICSTLRKGVAEYEAAGHKAARAALLKAIDCPTVAIEDPERAMLARRIRSAARQVEPTRTMTVFIRGAQGVRIARDGAPFLLKDGKDVFDTATDDAIDFQVLEGEIIQFTPEPVGKMETAADSKEIMTRFMMRNVFAVAAMIEGKPLPKTIWCRVAADEAGKAEPKVRPVALGRKEKSSLGELAEDLPEPVSDAKFWLTFNESDSSRFSTGWTPEHEACENAIRDRGLTAAWIGGSAKKITFALKVPDFK